MSIAAQHSSPEVANPGVHPIMPVPGEAQILVTHTPQQFEDLPVLTWLVEKVFHMMGVILFWGASGAGKTALLIDLILALVAGSAWAGRRVQQGSVLYCALEGAAGFRRRVSIALHHTGIEPGNKLHFIFEPVSLVKEQDVINLAKTALRHKAILIVIDTLAASLAGEADENSNRDMTLLTHNAKRLAMMTGSAVLITHHTGRNPAQVAERGAYSLRANVDTSIRVSRTGNDRAWEVVKARDGVDGVGGRFELVDASMPGPDGNDIESVVVRHLDGPVSDDGMPKVEALTPNQSAVFEQFKLLLDSEEALAEERGESIWNVGFPLDDCVRSCMAAVKVNDTRHRSTRTREAFQALVKAGLVMEKEGRLLLTN